MRVAVITGFPEEDWHSRRLVAALRRSAQVRVTDPSELEVQAGRKRPAARVLVSGEPAESFDAFLLARGLGRRGDPDFLFLAYRILGESGALVQNEIGALLAAQDKIHTSVLLSRAGVPTPPAIAAQDLGSAERALRRFGEAVRKPLWGSLGEGVARVRDDAAGRRALARALEQDGLVYLQAYVAGEGRDLRAFVVGGRVAGAIERRAAPGELAANIHRGGQASAIDLPPAFARAAVRAARALGLSYAGVDLLADGGGRPTVIEVNGNPAWRGLTRATGLDMAQAIAANLIESVQRRIDQEKGGRNVRERIEQGEATQRR